MQQLLLFMKCCTMNMVLEQSLQWGFKGELARALYMFIV